MSIKNKITAKYYETKIYNHRLEVIGIAIGEEDFKSLKLEFESVQRFEETPTGQLHALYMQLPCEDKPTRVYLTIGFDGVSFMIGGKE